MMINLVKCCFMGNLCQYIPINFLLFVFKFCIFNYADILCLNVGRCYCHTYFLLVTDVKSLLLNMTDELPYIVLYLADIVFDVD